MGIDYRLCELETAAAREREYNIVAVRLNGAFEKLKRIAGEDGWFTLDEYISAKNAEAEFMMRYAYLQGLGIRNEE